MAIRVAIVGVGNCASALLQGLTYYHGVVDPVPGLVRPIIGGYSIKDIEVVAAFDVVDSKVGYPLEDAIFQPPNGTIEFSAVIATAEGVRVQRGPTLDGLGRYIRDEVTESQEPVVEVTDILAERQVDVVVNYLPVGSTLATHYYADAALRAGCGFVNCIPVFLASEPEWAGRFYEANLPIIGDDIKSQVGATIVHRVLAQLFRDRGVTLDRTMQLNVGGNQDFKNMMERERLVSKKISKTQAVTSIAGVTFAPGDIHVGPSDHVPWLTDRKWAYIRLEGRAFGNVPLNLELKLEVWDSPNSAGIVVDCIRTAKLAMDRKVGGSIVAPSAYFMKSPPLQHDDDEALRLLEEFIG